MGQTPLGWRGRELPPPPDLNSYQEPPRGDYVLYVERLLAWSEEQRRLAAANARAAAAGGISAPTPAGPRPAARPGARGKAAPPHSDAAGASGVNDDRLAGQVLADTPHRWRQAGKWSQWLVARSWSAWMGLAWLGMVALFFLAPALLPLAMVLMVVAGLLRGKWKKLRQ